LLAHVLAATDGSESSDRLVECVLGLRRVGSTLVVLAHVFDPREVGGLYEDLRTRLQPRLDGQERALRDAGFDVVVETPLGVPYDELNRLGDEYAASLLVVGSAQHSLAGEALLGSTACSIVRNASRPVLLLRLATVRDGQGRERCRAACDDLFQHVLYATDFSDAATRALDYLEHVVRQRRSRVTLLHVQDKARIEPHLAHRLEEFNRVDAERLEGIANRLRLAGAAAVEAEVLYGSPTALILGRAEDTSLSLLVAGSQGRGFVAELFLGGVAHALAHAAPLPVLFVAAPR
jgi:nucleotide-binding universal stress UspA family protein